LELLPAALISGTEMRVFCEASMAELPEGEIHLWLAFTGAGEASASMDAVRRHLDAGESARMERIRLPGDRELFGTSRFLLRSALAHYTGISPETWRFLRDGRGKPRIDPRSGPASLRFSIAHTSGLAVVALAAGREIGVDVERADRSLDAGRLARRFFSAGERAGLEALPPEGRREGFVHTWTLKEAYLKAVGRGLTLSLDTFAFRLTGERPWSIGFSGEGDGADEGWRFALAEPRSPYVVALAAVPDGPGVLGVRCRRLLPDGGTGPVPCEPLGWSEGVAFRFDGPESDRHG
jgi:4'-phosphopantetheinyl transferase